MHLGELLKTEREKRGIRLADIASVTKIPVHHLKLIEEAKWGKLPPRPFIKGFLTSYCRLVGLNPDEIYRQYLSETEPKIDPLVEVPATPPVPNAAEVISNSKVVQIKPIAVSVLGVLLVGFFLWLIQVGKESAPQQVAVSPEPQQENMNREVASAPTVPATITEAPKETAPAVESEGHTLEVLTKERSWAKVVIDEAPPVEYHINPNEKTTLKAKNKIKLVLGTSEGAEVIHNGQAEPGKIDQGSTRYYIFPAGAKFPQDQTRRKLTEDSEMGESQPTVNEEDSSSSE